jgi:hypothetical protein
MAAQIHSVLGNFYYRIGLIQPTSKLVNQSFSYRIDPAVVGEEYHSGLMRAYYVEWISSGPDEWATAINRREADHRYHVTVYYPMVLPWAEMHEIISCDRHDMLIALRGSNNAVGVDGDPTLNVGLMHRKRMGDQLTRDSDVWMFTTSWACKILETE